MAEIVALELDSPQGEALRIEWDATALTGRRAKSVDDLRWGLDGEIDWEEVEALRIVSAALPDRRGLVLAALRPQGVEGHGDEVVAAALIADGSADAVAEPLLSVESDGEGTPVRIGLELHTEADAMPLRVAGDAIATGSERDGGLERIRAALDIRLEGKRSIGAYDILRPVDRPTR